MIKEAIIKLSKKEDLAYAEAEQVMNEIEKQTSYFFIGNHGGKGQRGADVRLFDRFVHERGDN